MPNYDYVCKECGHRFEAFQSMKDDALTTCPRCEENSLQRLIGAGAGLLFKGSGYYLTDYKKSSSSQATVNAESGGTNGDAGGSGSDSSAPASPAPSASQAKAEKTAS